MRWLLIDEFIDIQKGKRARGVRGVTRAEQSLTDNFPSLPIMHPSLMLEMMAQVGGVLVGATIDFTKEVVLAKISKVTFYKRVMAPTLLEIEGQLSDLADSAGSVHCEIYSKGKTIAEGDLFFGLFDKLDPKSKAQKVFSTGFMDTYAIRKMVV